MTKISVTGTNELYHTQVFSFFPLRDKINKEEDNYMNYIYIFY